jgi:hypothetical protein
MNRDERRWVSGGKDVEENEEAQEPGTEATLPELALDGASMDVGPEEPGVDVLMAEVEVLRQSEAARIAEVEELRAELAVARQERERELTALRTELADAQRAQVEAHRRAILAEHAGQIVEELVVGSTVGELDASLEMARAAYGRALESARRELGATVVPVGASPRLEPSPEELSPIAKITAALSRRG